jgi:hypothetical protein
MGRLGTAELFAIEELETRDEPSFRNRLVRLVEAYPGRIIDGIATRVPEDSVLMELETGMPHANMYFIEPLKQDGPGVIHEPTYVIDQANVVSIELVETAAAGPDAVIWPN